MRRAVILVPCIASVASVASCAVLGGLGDFKEVDCVGPTCPDGGLLTDDAQSDGGPANDGAITDPEAITISGIVSGLQGSGLVLQNNGLDDLPIPTNGPFTFATRITEGLPYVVTIGSQPTNPSQTCSVAAGSGTSLGNNITDVVVTCSTTAYTIGGTVLNFTGPTLTLANNGADDLIVPANGASFVFATKIASGAQFNVTLKTNPAGCEIAGNTGTVGNANVNSVVINCDASKFLVAGSIAGLNGAVILRNPGMPDLPVSSNGTFAFPTAVNDGIAFNITVATQPTYPPRSQTCVVADGAGTIQGANATTAKVACANNKFTVGGSITGLFGSVVLTNNGGDALTTNNNSFKFTTSMESGSTYSAAIKTQPLGRLCTIKTGTGAGTVTNGNVSSISISCNCIPPSGKNVCDDDNSCCGIRCDEEHSCIQSCLNLNANCNPFLPDCCLGLRCDQFSKCIACKQKGQNCQKDFDCCNGNCVVTTCK